jgi:hypothetical protein
VNLGILTVGHQTYESWSQICISQVCPRNLLETASVEVDTRLKIQSGYNTEINNRNIFLRPSN